MIPVKRALLSDETCVHLRQEIAAGTFVGELPSCRELALSLQVSVPTILTVLDQLASEGVIEKGKPRRPYRVVENAALSFPPLHERRRILVISYKPLGEYDSNSRAAVDRIMLDAMRQGWEFQHRIVAYHGSKQPSARWDDLIDEIRPTQLIALGGTLVLAEWAARRNIPTLFVGGVPGETPVVAIGVSLKQRLAEALERLLDLGHRHICMPMTGLEDYFVAKMHQTLRASLEQRGIPFVPTYHAPLAPRGNRKAATSLISSVIAAREPTAMIFIEWIDFISAVGLLAEHGLTLGRDVVGVILTHDPQLESFHPEPASFRLPLQRLERTLSEWMKNPNAPRFRKGGLMLQPSQFHEGEAFHPPRGI